MYYLLPKQSRDKLGSKFSTGMYLGKDPETGENYVGNATGQVVRARTMKRMTTAEMWKVGVYVHKLYQVPYEAGSAQRTVKKLPIEELTTAPLPPTAKLPDESDNTGLQDDVVMLDPPEGLHRQTSDVPVVDDDSETTDEDDDGPDTTMNDGPSTEQRGTMTGAHKRTTTDGDREEPTAQRQRICTLFHTIGNYVCNISLPEKLTKTTRYEGIELPVHVNELPEEDLGLDYEAEEMCDYEEEGRQRDGTKAYLA